MNAMNGKSYSKGNKFCKAKLVQKVKLYRDSTLTQRCLLLSRLIKRMSDDLKQCLKSEVLKAQLAVITSDCDSEFLIDKEMIKLSCKHDTMEIRTCLRKSSSFCITMILLWANRHLSSDSSANMVNRYGLLPSCNEKYKIHPISSFALFHYHSLAKFMYKDITTGSCD